MGNALQQYLDLYSEHGTLICRHAPHALNARREEAYKILNDLGLPKFGSENYEISDPESMLAPDYGLNIARLPLDVNPAESFRCGVPHLSTSLYFMINDIWGESKGARAGLPEGVEIGSLASYLKDDEKAKESYGKLADLGNPIVALNTMLVQDGLYLRVRKGVKVEKPIQLVNILQSLMPLMAVRRLLIIIEEDAEARLLICDHTQNHSIDMMSLQVTEVSVGRNAVFDIYDLEESGPKTNRMHALYLRQEEGSSVAIDGITLYNGRTRNEYHTQFAGERGELKLYGLGVEDKARVLDNFSFINHAVKNCHTDELFKYIVDDEAKGAFTGRIYVAPGASGTEAYQNNRNLVGSDTARMFSKPQLEIYNDDVKCSHGSATGQLDSLQVFYMRSRGLSEEEARLLLKQAFMSDVVNGVRLPVLRDRLNILLERRFAGEAAACGDCEICKE